MGRRYSPSNVERELNPQSFLLILPPHFRSTSLYMYSNKVRNWRGKRASERASCIWFPYQVRVLCTHTLWHFHHCGTMEERASWSVKCCVRAGCLHVVVFVLFSSRWNAALQLEYRETRMFFTGGVNNKKRKKGAERGCEPATPHMYKRLVACFSILLLGDQKNRPGWWDTRWPWRYCPYFVHVEIDARRRRSF